MNPLTLTIVIPALNEASRLPVLLSMLGEQTRPPDAVVVADAGSTDGTREVAAAAGARVVDGGLPGAGRNAGAAAASTDLLLFLDADDQPPPEWIEQAVAEFQERDLDVAAGQIAPVEREPGNLFACEVVNLYLQLMQHVAPHAPGFCIMVRREIHERIDGFDETVVLAEDHEYVQRAAEIGKFRVLRGMPMPTSMRRIEKEGLIQLAFKYLYCELHVVAGKPIREAPFEYEFAAFDAEKHKPVLVGLETVRERLSAFGDPFAQITAEAAERIGRLGDAVSTPERIEELLAQITPEELRSLHEYVSHRADRARRMQPIVLRRIRRRGEQVWTRLTAEARSD
jgi:glycosyltransferase involved in cell wall biosynthesis